MKIFKWIKKPNGNCPVQAEGMFLGYYFYFRSRYELSKIHFYKNKKDWNQNRYTINCFELKEYKNEYEAGWISKQLSKRLIFKGCLKFLIWRISTRKV
jgi:hypothetical protein